MKDWAAFEVEGWPEDEAREPVLLKVPFTFDLDGYRITGRIDRVDRVIARGETYYEIIDYKTGNGGAESLTRQIDKFCPPEGAQPSDYQLPLYALALAVGVSGGDLVHIAWADTATPGVVNGTPGSTGGSSFQLYYRNLNAGNWSAYEVVDATAEGIYVPSLAADSTNATVYAVWQGGDSTPNIYYNKRTGGSWGTRTQLSTSNTMAQVPSIALGSGGVVHVVWQGRMTVGTDFYEVVYRRWNGTSWEAAANLSNTQYESMAPKIAANGSNAFLVWADGQTGNAEILFTKSADNGANWNATAGATPTPTWVVPGGATNVAQGKSATQSTTYNGAGPERAVDGNTDGIFSDGSVTHTLDEPQPWWQVDLNAVYSIANIHVWNRTDCCNDRLSAFYVLVSEQPFQSGSLGVTLSQPGVSAYYVSGIAGTPTNVSIGRLGRYVRVQLTGIDDRVLSLAEVQVWATGGAITTPTPTNTPQPGPTYTPTATPTLPSIGNTTVKYYYFGSQRVAMRNASGVTYLHGDHLGSTSLSTNSGGIEAGRQSYYAFGGVRPGASGSLGTDFTFTGQRSEISWGIMDYGARFYDPQIGRFLKPDTFVLNLFDPQSLNRYSYVRNNPVKYTDPTGHMLQDPGQGNTPPQNDPCYPPSVHEGDPNCNGVKAGAEQIVKEKGGKDDLGAMADIVDMVANIYREWSKILPVLGYIFNGVSGNGTLFLVASGLSPYKCTGVGRDVHDCPMLPLHFKDSGFHTDFKDGNNQPYHVWGYIGQTANPDGNFPCKVCRLAVDFAIGVDGNLFHELFQGGVGVLLNSKELKWGTSWQDYVLAEKGMEIGRRITLGEIQPSELGNVLRVELGESGKGSSKWLDSYENFFGPLPGEDDINK